MKVSNETKKEKSKESCEDEVIEIATTRPETIFGDTAIMVNPEDERYKKLIGKTALIPIINKEIKIISSKKVDINFGTGIVKVTPAHDPNDYEVGINKNLEFVNILNKDGTLNENTPKAYRGLSISKARNKVVKELELSGALVLKKKHKQQVGHCSRTGTVIEPMISLEWFVKMDRFAKIALQAFEDGEFKFIPKHWENTYKHWLKNIRDWCISRKLWWGHKILL